MKKLRILVACEESQRVCTEFRKLGHEAYSCDIQEQSGGHPEWHVQNDVIKLLKPNDIGFTEFRTVDGKIHYFNGKFDLMVCHPPCIYLTNCATRSHSLRCTTLNKINERTSKRIEAMDFFMKFVNAECDHIAIENPVGVMNTCYRKPDQIIDPYQFAKSTEDFENYVTKSTCLWLKGLPVLRINNLPKPDNEVLFGRHPSGKVRCWEEMQGGGEDRGKNRSKTFPGIAKAMAIQWSEYLTGGTP